MATLREKFHSWAIRPGHYNDVLGGGSAFDHLTEDGDGLHVDAPLWLTDQLFQTQPDLATAQANESIGLQVEGDTEARLKLFADGSVKSGDGANPSDVQLARDQEGYFRVGHPDGWGGIVTGDSTLAGPSVWMDEGGIFARGDATQFMGFQPDGSGNVALYAHEVSADPAAPNANEGKLYFRDNGAGKTQLVARFNTGAVQVVATEP